MFTSANIASVHTTTTLATTLSVVSTTMNWQLQLPVWIHSYPDTMYSIINTHTSFEEPLKLITKVKYCSPKKALKLTTPN